MSDDEIYKQKYLKYKKKYLELKELQGGNIYQSGLYVFFLTNEGVGYLPPDNIIPDFNKFTDNIGNCSWFLRIGKTFTGMDALHTYDTIYTNRGLSNMLASRSIDSAKAVGSATISGAKAVGSATVAGVNMARNSTAAGLRSASNFVGNNQNGGDNDELVGGDDDELVGGKQGCDNNAFVIPKELRVAKVDDATDQKIASLAALVNTNTTADSQIVRVIIVDVSKNTVIKKQFNI